MTEQPVYESENITMCTDGKYRWVYELNLYKNPAIIKEVGRVMLISLVIVLVLISGFQIIDGIGTLAERLLFVAELAGILIVILVVRVEFYSKEGITAFNFPYISVFNKAELNEYSGVDTFGLE